jgi:hypothetical protein
VVVTIYLPVGIFVGYKVGAVHGFLIGFAVGLLIPCLTILVTGIALAIVEPKESSGDQEVN